MRVKKEVEIGEKDSTGSDEIYGEFFRCPRCDSPFVMEMFLYCPMCGVKLKWKEGEAE